MRRPDVQWPRGRAGRRHRARDRRTATSGTAPQGKYPNQHASGAGIPEWIKADRPLDGEDVVLWHTFSATPVVRTEDWPVMPVEYAGFTLGPANFFERNPALDLPRDMNAAHGGHCH
jgi:primary-amine oxidase